MESNNIFLSIVLVFLLLIMFTDYIALLPYLRESLENKGLFAKPGWIIGMLWGLTIRILALVLAIIFLFS